MHLFSQRRFRLLFLIFLLAFIFVGCDRKEQVLTESVASSFSVPESMEEEVYDFCMEDAGILVDISGAVMYPGVYLLKSGCRVYEAINLAGGLTEGAYTGNLNLVTVLKDGDHLAVPTETADDKQSGLININSASFETLCTLPGIGETKAKAIIEYRSKNGNFRDTSDLLKVSGIGQSTYERLKDMVIAQ